MGGHKRNTIVPLCHPYANGNCVHYDGYSGTPGTEPDPSFYSGGVNGKITWILSLTSIVVSGNFALSSGTTSANGRTVNPSASCILNVTFTPKSKGPVTGKGTITDNALISPQVIILSGTGN